MIDASFFLSAEDETIVRVARQGSEREFSVMPIDNPELARMQLRAPEPTIPVAPIIPVLRIGE
jgi:hypothetical protein